MGGRWNEENGKENCVVVGLIDAICLSLLARTKPVTIGFGYSISLQNSSKDIFTHITSMGRAFHQMPQDDNSHLRRLVPKRWARYDI